MKDYKFTILAPAGCDKEMQHVISWVFDEVFGIPAKVIFEPNCRNFEISHGDSDRKLVIDGSFVHQTKNHWLKSQSLCSYSEADIPSLDRRVACLYGKQLESGLWLNKVESLTELGIDVFGSLFFLMSRYEEAVTLSRDFHGRFVAADSVVPVSVIASRAIGNELIELLWELLMRSFPFLKRKSRCFRVIPSHDIDHPSYYAGRHWMGVTKSTLKLAYNERDVLLPLNHLYGAGMRYFENYGMDPWQTHEWIMNQSEGIGTRSAFHYIPEVTDAKMDWGLDLFHPQVKGQIKRIHERGHEIGLHPGYLTMENPRMIESGASKLRRLFDELGVRQNEIGGRQHFLRWSTPLSAIAWQQAGLQYDSSLGYAELAGFRCGLCYEYPLYDLYAREPLELRERPLVLMECSVIDKRYEGLGHDAQAFDRMSALKAECRKYHGDFTILWHNHRFTDRRERRLYRAVLNA